MPRRPSNLRYTPEDELRNEIDQHHTNPQLYARLAQRLQAENQLDYDSMSRLTRHAIDQKNMSAVVGMARVNRYAVVNALQQDPKSANIIARMLSDPDSPNGGVSNAPIELYYQLRATAPKELKLKLRRIARQAIYSVSRRISHMGLRPDAPRSVPPPYQMGEEFDLDATLDYIMDTHPTGLAYVLTHKMVQSGKRLPYHPKVDKSTQGNARANLERVYVQKDPLTHNDIVSIQRHPRSKAAILLLDTSGSMYGDKLPTAAITATVLSHHLREDYYAIVTFNREASTLKSFKNRETNPEKLADSLLDLQPAGYTNIGAAFRAAISQLNYLRKIPGGSAPSPSDTWTILITDGQTNRGPDPISYAGKIPVLHVIQTPPPTALNMGEVSPRKVKVAKTSSWFNNALIQPQKTTSEAVVVEGEVNPYDLIDQDQLDPSTRLLRRLARIGHGRHVKLTKYTDIPRALSRLLAGY